MINALLLAGIADHIASYFSMDAAHWRAHIASSATSAIPVQWLAGTATTDLNDLIAALRIRTIAPYRSTDRTDALPIVTARPDNPAVAIVTFWPEDRTEYGPGVRYELRFVASGEVWPGWFSLRAA
jgi:hypothetical protein